MFEDIKRSVSDWSDEDEIREYLTKILDKEAFDKSGLIYGMGHAVYSLSDPRAEILKDLAKDLSEEKGLSQEYNLYTSVERIASELISKKRRIYKGVSANVDFQRFCLQNAGFAHRVIYSDLCSCPHRGWSAHRLEELINSGKIIRPSYINVKNQGSYLPIDER